MKKCIFTVLLLFIMSSSGVCQVETDTETDTNSLTVSTDTSSSSTNEHTVNASNSENSSNTVALTQTEDAKTKAETNTEANSNQEAQPTERTEKTQATSPEATEKNESPSPKITITQDHPLRHNPVNTISFKKPYSSNMFVTLRDEFFLGTLIITGWGVHFWDWFQYSFRFEKEYGFTQKSSTGGADKIGHFWGTYIISEFLNAQLLRAGYSKNRAAIFSATAGMMLMTWLEIGDGTSKYGFSMEDLLADFIGAAVSMAGSLSPHFRELVDFRLQYFPTSEYFKKGEIVADYSGMKFLMALKFAGIPPLKKTPFRFLETHLGYYSRGFRTFDKNQDDASRHLYIGVGLNMYELLHPMLPKKAHRPVKMGFRYYQIPFTSLEVKNWTYR